MKIIADTLQFNIEKETAVAIGKFDGIHLGHKKLLNEILSAKKRGLAACVFTFDKPISALFGKETAVLTTNEEKRKLFEKMGVDYLVEFPLTLQSAATPPEEFVSKYLVKQMNMKFIAAGSDLSFGDKGLGSAELLEKMAIDGGYEVKIIDKVLNGEGEEISSSLVRNCVLKADMIKVRNLLGTAYSIGGTVEHGNHLGSTIGFPTINIYPQENKLLPPFGVYKSKVHIAGNPKVYMGISNVGKKPTVGDKNKPGIETYIYDFDEDIYGKEVVVELLAFMRPEQKFDGLDALKRQLDVDIQKGKDPNNYNGIINVHKEKGYTSFDVVAKLRGMCGQKKIGHTGTLDPDATGVLPVCLGNATKVCELLTDHDKEYVAEMLLGTRTDTQDVSGKVIASSNELPDEAKVASVINEFVGEIMQIPPMYSALKIDGQKLCDLARKGIEVERKERPVTIYSIDIEEIKLPVVRMRVACSKGTYIRTLCDDIGEKLGCHATMQSLVRTRHSSFGLENALTLSQLQKLRNEGTLDSVIVPVDELFSDYPKVTVKEECMKALENGNILKGDSFVAQAREGFAKYIRVYKANGDFAGIYKYHEREAVYKPEKMFL